MENMSSSGFSAAHTANTT
jgi:hypothetical protein